METRVHLQVHPNLRNLLTINNIRGNYQKFANFYCNSINIYYICKRNQILLHYDIIMVGRA